MVQVYAEPLCRRHYAGILSLAVLFRLTLVLGSIAIAIVVAYATGGFWIKLRPTLAQPNVQYANQALLVLQGATPGSEMMWSTSQTLNSEFNSQLVPASVQVGYSDNNFDGKPDVLTFVVSVQSQQPVYGINALFELTYSYESSVRLEMYSFAYLAASSPSPGGTLYTDGELLLTQKSPIMDRRYNSLYNTPLLNYDAPTLKQASQPSTMFQMETILRSYLSHNYTTTYANVYPVWKPGPGKTFTLNMVVRIPADQVVWYRPQVIEMLKFAWIQFLVGFVVLWWFYSHLESFAFHRRLLGTRVVSDLQSKPARF